MSHGFQACQNLRVSGQNGVSLLYIMLEIHHSGWKPSIYYYDVDCSKYVTEQFVCTTRFALSHVSLQSVQNSYASNYQTLTASDELCKDWVA